MNRPQKRDTFIENLDILRKSLELNNQEFATILGVHRQEWVRWKNNRYGMRLSNCWRLVGRLTEHFGVELKFPDFLGTICEKCEKPMFLCKVEGCEG